MSTVREDLTQQEFEQLLAKPFCDLCGEQCDEADFNEAAGLTICPSCMEAAIHASAFDARTTLGLVGASR